jgi:hypothetical protein
MEWSARVALFVAVLLAVWSESASGQICFAVGASGSAAQGWSGLVLTTLNGGVVWQAVGTGSLPGVVLTSVACPLPWLCYAVGINYSASNYGESFLTTDGGSSWTATTLTFPTSTLLSVSCASVGVCVATGGTSNQGLLASTVNEGSVGICIVGISRYSDGVGCGSKVSRGYRPLYRLQSRSMEASASTRRIVQSLDTIPPILALYS